MTSTETRHLEIPVDASIPEVLAERMADFADRPAIKGPGHSLTFTALREAVNGLAAMLQEKAGGPVRVPEPVAIVMDHDAPPIVALLGVMQAGLIAVPLDPRDPPARTQELLAAAGARLLVTDSHRVDALRRIVPAETECVGFHLGGASVHSTASVAGPGIDPDAPCAIMHTSGSIGEPRGVVYTHRGLLFNARNYTGSAGLGCDDRMTLLARCHVPAAFSAIFGALLNGACILPFDVTRSGITDLRRWLQEESITVYHSVPTLFRRLCECLTRDDRFPRLRLIKIGGEPALNYDIKLFQRHFPESCRLLNGFGMTEACGNLCHHYFDHDSPTDLKAIPVGRPLPGIDLVLIDGQGRPVPKDGEGEIAFRSPGRAGAFWRSSDLEEKLIPSPLADGGGPFLKTGDIGRLLPDGSLAHLGRGDAQLKIRGHRIHPAKVESALLEHPDVTRCVVADWGRGSEEKHLVAWIVTGQDSGSAPAHEDLKHFLSSRLPAAWIPSVFVPLEEIPLTGSGKVVRRDLPDPFLSDDARTTDSREHPANAVELKLSKIWRKILRRDHVPMTASFFQVGGDSLLASVLVSKVEESFGVDLPFERLIEDPTIRGIADFVRSRETQEKYTPLFAAKKSGSGSPLFWAPGAGVHAAIGAGESGRQFNFDRPLYTLRYPGFDGVELPLETVEENAAFFVNEIRRVQPSGPYWIGGGSFGGLVAFEAARQLTRDGESVELLVIRETRLSDSLTPRDDLPLSQRFERSLRPLMPVGKRHKMGWRGIRERFDQLRHQLLIPLKRRHCRRDERPLPFLYRSHDSIRAAVQAKANFQPQEYQGHTIIFRNVEKEASLSRWFHLDPSLGWARWCPHHKIIKLGEPQDEHDSIAREFARKLDAILDSRR